MFCGFILFDPRVSQVETLGKVNNVTDQTAENRMDPNKPVRHLERNLQRCRTPLGSSELNIVI